MWCRIMTTGDKVSGVVLEWSVARLDSVGAELVMMGFGSVSERWAGIEGLDNAAAALDLLEEHDISTSNDTAIRAAIAG